MSVQQGANLYTQGFGSRPEGVEVPVIASVNPTAQNVNYPQGKQWVNEHNNTVWFLTSFASSQGVTTATWTQV
jgi:hypothetical protein